MARSAHTSTSRCMTYLWIHHSNRLEKKNTGTTSSHSQLAPCRRETHQAIVARPTAYITPIWTRPLYRGWICAWYSSRNLRWRSDIMGGSSVAWCRLRSPAADISDVYLAILPALPAFFKQPEPGRASEWQGAEASECGSILPLPGFSLRASRPSG